MEDRIQHLKDDLAAHTDYMQTIARATYRLNSAVGDLLDSLPPETRAEMLRKMAEEQAGGAVEDGGQPNA